ncbi:MAG: hypothetical protein WCA32_10420 [Chromatiaceae bacterium]
MRRNETGALVSPFPAARWLAGFRKATAFGGPFLVGWVTYLARSQRVGMGAVVVLFLLGFYLMMGVPEARPANEEQSH